MISLIEIVMDLRKHIFIFNWQIVEQYSWQIVYEHLLGKAIDWGQFLYQLMLDSAGNNNHYSITQMQILTPGILEEHMSGIIQFQRSNYNF